MAEKFQFHYIQLNNEIRTLITVKELLTYIQLVCISLARTVEKFC